MAKALIKQLFAVGIGVLTAFGCKPAADSPEKCKPVEEGESARVMLLQAVLGAERGDYGKDFAARRKKEAVARAALGILAGRDIEELARETEKAQEAPHVAGFSRSREVELREGVIHVRGLNYEWRIIPSLEDGCIENVTVEASPICIWFVR